MADSVDLDRVFRALGAETRRDMLRALARGPRSMGALVGPLPMSRAAAAKHVALLEAAGLVRRERRGREIVVRLAPATLLGALQWFVFTARHWPPRPEAVAPKARPAPRRKPPRLDS